MKLFYTLSILTLAATTPVIAAKKKTPDDSQGKPSASVVKPKPNFKPSYTIRTRSAAKRLQEQARARAILEAIQNPTSPEGKAQRTAFFSSMQEFLDIQQQRREWARLQHRRGQVRRMPHRLSFPDLSKVDADLKILEAQIVKPTFSSEIFE